MGCICCKVASTTDEPNASSIRKGLSSKSFRLFSTLSRRGTPSLSPPSTSATTTTTTTTISRAKSGKENEASSSRVAPIKPVISKSGPVERPKRGSGHQRSRVRNEGEIGGKREEGNGKVEETSLTMPSGEPFGFSGEHLIAGWPAWLANVAPEAVKGWLPRRADSFEKLDKIGQGTYSSVYRARDLQTGKIVALKKVRFMNMDPESVRFMAREIHILRRLDHPNVIKLEGIVASRTSQSLYLVFEYMEHDLAGLTSTPGVKFTEPQVKCFMQQLLQGLYHCHTHGVLHRDIKGSNLLIDNNGNLKIGDFGLATFFDPSKMQQLTSRVVTLWYRPPELLLGATEYGVAVDLWSTGCILGELLAGKPIMPGRTEVEQLHKIFKLCGSPSEDYWKKTKLSHATVFKPQSYYKRCFADTFKDFPQSALSLLDSLLAIEPEDRGTVASALQSDFFKTKPLPCDPSSLPKFPPSKEYDAKLRDEKARRKKQEALGGRGAESVRPGRKDCKQNPGQDAAAESQINRYNIQEDTPTPAEQTGLGLYPKTGDSKPPLPGQTYNSVRVPNGVHLKTQRSCKPQYAMDSDMANGKQVLDRTTSTHRKDSANKESNAGYGRKNARIQYSGPLMPHGGNVDDMLKEHERLIQQAVRKARVEKIQV
ncbi:hypothetical protein LUZ60_007660 [Juncus effusus]|nr:hypothetical protein LUZ60_007660 [Juncus effusus]